jgi:hypothetical protein
MYTPDLDSEEAALFDSWSLHCEEIAARRGEPVRLIDEGIPLLMNIMMDCHPEWDFGKAASTWAKFEKVFQRAVVLFGSTSEGGA